jgi:hypothetical protein
MALDALAKLLLVVLWAAGVAVVLGGLGFRF